MIWVNGRSVIELQSNCSCNRALEPGTGISSRIGVDFGNHRLWLTDWRQSAERVGRNKPDTDGRSRRVRARRTSAIFDDWWSTCHIESASAARRPSGWPATLLPGAAGRRVDSAGYIRKTIGSDARGRVYTPKPGRGAGNGWSVAWDGHWRH